MQKHVNLVDLVKSFPTNILLQNLASIQKRTSPVKFAHFAEKSGKGSISNLSSKVFAAVERMLTFLVAACSKNGRSIVHLAKERCSQEVQLSVERADPDPAVLEYLSKVPAFGVA